MATKEEIQALILSKIPDNQTGQITEADLRDSFDAVLDEIYEESEVASKGIKPFETKALMDAFTPGASDPEISFVMNDGTSSNNGWYRWDGSVWVKRGEFYQTDLDYSENSEAPTSKAVADYSNNGKENEWIDPDFTRQYVSDAEGNITGSNHQFAFLNTNDIIPFNIDGYSCARVRLQSASLKNIAPSFSKEYLQSLGWENSDNFKVGYWIKVEDASGGSTRTIYPNADLTGTIVQDSSDWLWVESSETLTFNTANDWTGFYLGVRYGNAGEYYYIRGLTLVNTTQGTWTGQRLSKKHLQAQSVPLTNLNPFVENIFENTPLYKDAVENDSGAFTKSIISIADKGIQGVQFASDVVDDYFRMNVNLASAVIDNVEDFRLPKKAGYFKLGFFINSSNVNTSGIDVYMDINPSSEKYQQKYIPGNKEVWVETPAIWLSEGDKDMTGLIQINATPTSGNKVTYQVYGVTYAILDDPNQFRFSKLNIASGSPFYGKKFCSYGDSITAYDKYQKFLNAKIGCENFLRGIGGTTMANTEEIAWVDDEGFLIARPPDPEPSGTEGVDYFEIDSGMCTQERVDTIPNDTELLIVLAGTNDWDTAVSIGTRNDVASDLADNTFYAAWKSFFTKIHTRIPTAKVVVLNITYRENENTSTNVNGDYLYEFRDAIKVVSAMYGHPVIDTNDVGVNDLNWDDFSLPSDGVHPNNAHFELIAEKIKNLMI